MQKKEKIGEFRSRHRINVLIADHILKSLSHVPESAQKSFFPL